MWFSISHENKRPNEQQVLLQVLFDSWILYAIWNWSPIFSLQSLIWVNRIGSKTWFALFRLLCHGVHCKKKKREKSFLHKLFSCIEMKIDFLVMARNNVFLNRYGAYLVGAYPLDMSQYDRLFASTRYAFSFLFSWSIYICINFPLY